MKDPLRGKMRVRRSRLLVSALAFSLATSAGGAKTAPSNVRQEPSGAQQNSDAAATAELIDECAERTASMLARIFDYTYTHTSTFRKRGERGQVESEHVSVFEAYPVRRRKFVYILVSKGGVPVGAEKVELERRRAAGELAEAEERAAKARRRRDVTPAEQPPEQDTRFFGIWYNRGGLSGKRFSLIPTDFLRTHEFYAPRRATFNNREAVVFSFRPRAGAAVTDTSGRLRATLGGRVWVDAVDKVLMRLEAVPLEELSDADASVAPSPNAHAPVEFELTRLPNGTWVPSLGSLNTYGRQSAFKDVKFDFNYRCNDFRLFSTGVDEVDIKPPRQ